MTYDISVAFEQCSDLSAYFCSSRKIYFAYIISYHQCSSYCNEVPQGYKILHLITCSLICIMKFNVAFERDLYICMNNNSINRFCYLGLHIQARQQVC